MKKLKDLKPGMEFSLNSERFLKIADTEKGSAILRVLNLTTYETEALPANLAVII